MACRQWCAASLLVLLAGYISSVARAQPPTFVPLPVPHHLDPGELSCASYGPDQFVSDDSVTKQFVPSSTATVRTTLPPPCVEEVSTGVAQDVKGSGGASNNKGALSALFGASRTALERLQNGFDLYSWLTFIALNSPNDPNADFGDFSASTVWEQRFFPLDQVIRSSEDTSIKNVNLFQRPDVCPQPEIGKPPPTMFMTVDDVAFDQPFRSGPIVDQEGNYTLNTIFMNSTMMTFINKSGLYTAQGQKDFKQRIDFDTGQLKPSAALGSVMIKASWKVLTEKDDFAEFHTVEAWRFFPGTKAGPAHCDIQTLGLVGLHIVHKTQGRRQWIWTTFEHVRNVPGAMEVANGRFKRESYLFFDAAVASASRVDNHTPPQPWDADRPPLQKSQIVRAQEITADTTKINDEAHRYLTLLQGKAGFAKSNVWLHYQLISTQWPADFRCAAETNEAKQKVLTNQQTDPNCLPAPEFLPNSTLETYVQHDIGAAGGVPQSTSSCIACHNNAVAYQDLDFGDSRSLSHTKGLTALESDCNGLAPKGACSPASDFTFILEQVCAPTLDPLTHKLNNQACKHDH